VSHGLTLVVVTHDVTPLLPILTRVVTLQDGRVVRDEPASPARPAGTPGHGADPHCGPGRPDPGDGWLGARGLEG
jgi:energy-coupling factor transporter ATP-binding protein EcfA2